MSLKLKLMAVLYPVARYQYYPFPIPYSAIPDLECGQSGTSIGVLGD